MKSKKFYHFCCLCLIIVTNILAAQKILVTGGLGFIGSHVAEFLLKRGDTVVIIDNGDCADKTTRYYQNLSYLKDLEQSHNMIVYHDDICDLETLDNIFQKEQPQLICHLAAKAGTRASSLTPKEYLQTNIIGTFNIFECARKFNINHVVYASSSSIYGNNKQIPFTETDFVNNPLNVYAMSKISCELLAYVYFYLYKISSTGLRFFTVYGPRVRPDLAPFIFMDKIDNKQPIQLFGDGSIKRDFTYIDDIVDGIISSLDHPIKYKVVNLGRGEPVSLCELITMLEHITQKNAIIEYQSTKPEDAVITYADIEAARTLLGYKPRTSIYEGLEKTYAWYSNNVTYEKK